MTLYWGCSAPLAERSNPPAQNRQVNITSLRKTTHLFLLFAWGVVLVQSAFGHILDHECLLLAAIAGICIGVPGKPYWVLWCASILICLILLLSHDEMFDIENMVGIAALPLCGLTRLLNQLAHQSNEARAGEDLDNTISIPGVSGMASPVDSSFFGEDFESEVIVKSNSRDSSLKEGGKSEESNAEPPSVKTAISGDRSKRMAQFVATLQDSGDFAPRQLAHIQSAFSRIFRESEFQDVIADELPRGTPVGDYTIERLLGRGGAARVYLARTQTNELLAIKVLHDTKFSSRFEREIKLVQQLAHPNIVIAYEAGIANGVNYLAMEYLPGGNLYRYVKNKGPMSWQESIEVIYQAADALGHAHQRGLVHRDVKPGNLMWDLNGQIKITDLGLAGLLEAESELKEEEFHTKFESIAGTPDYMAPEQAFSLGSATPKSDIYSLGSTWFYLLMGHSRNPGSDTADKLACLRECDLKSLPNDVAPDEVLAIWQKMSNHHPSNRYKDTDELLKDLESVREDTKRDSKTRLVVLVVEDDQDDLFVTLEVLKRTNRFIQTKEVDTLAKATELGEDGYDFDAILLDLNLSDSYGLETVERARTAFPDSPIIVLTGDDDLRVGKACIEVGADEYICKADLTVQQLERSIFITQSRVSRRQLPQH